MTPDGIPAPVGAQAEAVLRILDQALPDGQLLGAVLYGSAVSGGLRPDSDLDLFAVLSRAVTHAQKRALIEGLVPISWQHSWPEGWRPVELTLVVQADVRPWSYPPRFDFQYGEWLRANFVAGDLAPWPPVNPDVAIQISMVLSSGRALTGPPPATLLDPVPHNDLVHAMKDEVPRLVDELDSDTRNVLLTLARVWTTVATGEIRTKDAAADWALARLDPRHRAVVALARRAYLGEARDASYDRVAAHGAADAIVRELTAALPPADASV